MELVTAGWDEYPLPEELDLLPTQVGSTIEDCEQCGREFVQSPMTHDTMVASYGDHILEGFCSKECESTWFFQDRQAQNHRDWVEGL